MEPFAQATDVQRRLDFTLGELETLAVEAALEDLSNEARFIANRTWTDVDILPNPVRNTVVKAVARWAKNMNGYVQSRAGDETLAWPDLGPEAGAPAFTAREEKLIRAVGDGRTGTPFLGTAELYAHIPPGKCEDKGYIDVDYGGKPFPFNAPYWW